MSLGKEWHEVTAVTERPGNTRDHSKVKTLPEKTNPCREILNHRSSAGVPAERSLK